MHWLLSKLISMTSYGRTLKTPHCTTFRITQFARPMKRCSDSRKETCYKDDESLVCMAKPQRSTLESERSALQDVPLGKMESELIQTIYLPWWCGHLRSTHMECRCFLHSSTLTSSASRSIHSYQQESHMYWKIQRIPGHQNLVKENGLQRPMTHSRSWKAPAPTQVSSSTAN